MRKVRLFAVGRLRSAELRGLCDDYYRRCSRRLRITEQEVRDLSALKAAIPPRSTLVVLDERGEQLSSRVFAERLRGWSEQGGRELVFVMGGADGLDDQLRSRADHMLALSKMTLAHRLARVLFAEQLYRAVSIIEGSPYHR